MSWCGRIAVARSVDNDDDARQAARARRNPSISRTQAITEFKLALVGVLGQILPPSPFNYTYTAAIPIRCVGDCDGDGQVKVSELITAVNVALGLRDVDACSACDADDDGHIRISELISAVHHAGNGC
jgi:hypothetical protein